MQNKEENDMATVETKLSIDAFKEMKKLLQSEMKAQGLTPDDIKKAIGMKRHEK